MEDLVNISLENKTPPVSSLENTKNLFKMFANPYSDEDDFEVHQEIESIKSTPLSNSNKKLSKTHRSPKLKKQHYLTKNLNPNFYSL